MSGTDTLPAGSQLVPGQYLISVNKLYKATFETDGNFTLSGTAQIWSTNTTGQGGESIKMEPDGNLVMYNASKYPVWMSNSGSTAQEGIKLVVTTDGHLKIMHYDQEIWSRPE
ncbi:hypothetical protein AALO_G00242080 [Alosa alosa]|uniref:Bulb-type lectin domain-containing protein n=1 Tax=Alosa alosa TaxID=278164 RepID=A0AAV6FSB6_9TELE|nr:hypothetical protein AALO_G00242080 [Alosa alosa]